MRKKLGIKASAFYVFWRFLGLFIGLLFVVSMVMSTSQFGSAKSLSDEEKAELLSSKNFQIAAEAAGFIDNSERYGNLEDIQGIRCTYRVKRSDYSNDVYSYVDVYIDVKGKEDIFLSYNNGVFNEKTGKVNPNFTIVDSEDNRDVVYLGSTLDFIKQIVKSTDQYAD